MNKKIIWGIAFMIFGFIMGLSALEIIPGVITLFLLTVGFLAAYMFYKRSIGFLIPGSVFLALAVFATMNQYNPRYDGIYFLILLGLAFIAILFLHTIRIETKKWGLKYWPLFPAIIFFLTGGLILTDRYTLISISSRYINLITPISVIVIGIGILIVGNTSCNKTNK